MKDKLRMLLDRMRSSEYITAPLLFVKNIFNITGSVSRKLFLISVVYAIVFVSLITSLITNTYAIDIIMLVMLIGIITLITRRVNDTGIRWYISSLPILFFILCVASILIVSWSNISYIYKVFGSAQIVASIDPSIYIGDNTSTLLNVLAISLLVYVIIFIAVITRDTGKLSKSKATQVIYIVVSLIVSLVFSVSFNLYFSSISKALTSSNVIVDDSSDDSSSTISTNIVVNGAFVSDVDDESSEDVIAYYATNASSFTDSFEKFITDDDKIDDDIYCLPILSQNVTDDGNTYPLIEVGLYNTSDSAKDVILSSCEINSNLISLNTTVNIDPGVTFIPIKISELDKLNGGELFQIVLNNNTLVHTTLFDTSLYSSVNDSSSS